MKAVAIGLFSVWVLLPVMTLYATDVGSGEPIGLVLSSGGGKGAYHLGVWEALSERKLTRRIVAISGSSVGAICGAVFAGVPESAAQRDEWRTATSIFRIHPAEDEVVRKLEKAVAKKCEWYGVEELSSKLVQKLRSEAETEVRIELLPPITLAWKRMDENPMLDSDTWSAASFDPLVSRLDIVLRDPFAPHGPMVYATAIRCDRRERRAFCLNRLDFATRKKAVCASASIPVVFPAVEIDGVKWRDGGWVEHGGDKTPIDPILDNHPEVKTIIVVYLHDRQHLPPEQQTSIKQKAAHKGIQLVEIIPSEDIGGGLNGWLGVFDTAEDTTNHLIDIGKRDTLWILDKDI